MLGVVGSAAALELWFMVLYGFVGGRWMCGVRYVIAFQSGKRASNN